MEERMAFEKRVIETLRRDVEREPSAAHHPSLDVLIDSECGELPPRERARLEGHLARCPTCRARRATLAEALEGRLRDLCGLAPSWSYASWRAGQVPRRAFGWRPMRVALALGSAAAVVCLGLAVRETLRPVERLVARGETASGLSGWAIGLFAAAGLLLAAIGLYLARRRKRRRR